MLASVRHCSPFVRGNGNTEELQRLTRSISQPGVMGIASISCLHILTIQWLRITRRSTIHVGSMSTECSRISIDRNSVIMRNLHFSTGRIVLEMLILGAYTNVRPILIGKLNEGRVVQQGLHACAEHTPAC